jgi:hypothetical protein
VVRPRRAASRRAARRLGAKGGELDDRPALGRRRAQLELRLEVPRPNRRADRIGCDAAPRTAVAAEDQAAARRDNVGEEPLDECALPLGRDVDELGPDEVEAARRLPAERVPEEDPVGPMRPPPARELDEARSQIAAVRLDVVGKRPRWAAARLPSVPRPRRSRIARAGCRPRGRRPRRSRPSPRTNCASSISPSARASSSARARACQKARSAGGPAPAALGPVVRFARPPPRGDRNQKSRTRLSRDCDESMSTRRLAGRCQTRPTS